jgi:hypothetical protein
VEHRQGIEYDILRVERDASSNLMAVRLQVSM